MFFVFFVNAVFFFMFSFFFCDANIQNTEAKHDFWFLSPHSSIRDQQVCSYRKFTLQVFRHADFSLVATLAQGVNSLTAFFAAWVASW